jgi:hypothetical protein
LFGASIMFTNLITNPYVSYIFVTVYMVQISKYIMHKVLSTHYISKQIEKRNFEFKIPRLLRVLNRSDLRSKLGRIEYTKIPYGTGTRNFRRLARFGGVYLFYRYCGTGTVSTY